MSLAQGETTAILVDGAFYCRRAYNLLGEKTPAERAAELVSYCHRHLAYKDEAPSRLYRIFYLTAMFKHIRSHCNTGVFGVP